jgi:hypothetical protein
VTDSSVIKSFLYEIGFKVDDASVAAMRSASTKAQNTLHDTEAKGDVKAESEAKKRTTRKIQDQKRQTDTAIKSTKESTEKTARGLSTMFEAVFAAIAIDEIVNTFQKITDGLDGLYWQSIRIKSSAENIKTFAYGFSQVGGSVDGAKQSLTAFSDWVTTGFGSAGLLKGLLGVDTHDTNGQLKDTVALFKETGKALANLEKTKGPQYATMIAGMMGIDRSTMLVMMRDASQFEDQQTKFYRSIGLDVDKAAESAHRFKLAENELFADLGDLTDKEGGDFLKWLDDVGKKYGGQFAHIANDIGEMSKALNVLSKDFGFLGNVSDFVFKGMLGWVDGVIKEITNLARLMDDIANRRWGAAAKDGAAVIKESPAGRLTDWIREQGRHLRGVPEGGAPAATSSGGGSSGGGSSGSDGGARSGQASGGNGSLADRNNNPGNIMSGNTYNHYATMADGYISMGKQIMTDYFKHGQNTIRKLIDDPKHGWANEWSPGNSHTATNNYMMYVAKSLGIGLDDKFTPDSRTLQMLMTSMNSFERGGSRGAAPLMAMGGSSSSASINQKTEIHVHGSGDPKATANETANAQSRVNGQLLRNTQAALV